MALNGGSSWRRPLAAWALATAALLAAGGGSAAAAAPTASPAAPQVSEVVVPGQANKAVRERRLETFVGHVPALNNGQALARWVDPVCPVVAGMTETQGEYVLARLFQVARAAGAPVIDNGRCDANTIILATADPDGMVKALERRNPKQFADATADQIRRFEATKSPVRAWYNARLAPLTTGADSPFEGLDGLPRNTPVIHHAVDTRLHSNSPYKLASAIVIVDSARLAGMKMGALADYIAVAVLTQLQPDSDGSGAPSILGLFTAPQGSAPPDGLTPWDTAFLHALYHTSLEDLHQGTTIAIRMDEALSRGDNP